MATGVLAGTSRRLLCSGSLGFVSPPPLVPSRPLSRLLSPSLTSSMPHRCPPLPPPLFLWSPLSPPTTLPPTVPLLPATQQPMKTQKSWRRPCKSSSGALGSGARLATVSVRTCRSASKVRTGHDTRGSTPMPFVSRGPRVRSRYSLEAPWGSKPHDTQHRRRRGRVVSLR